MPGTPGISEHHVWHSEFQIPNTSRTTFGPTVPLSTTLSALAIACNVLLFPLFTDLSAYFTTLAYCTIGRKHFPLVNYFWPIFQILMSMKMWLIDVNG